MMYCWSARRHFADSIDGRMAPELTGRLREHLAACVRCDAELRALRGVSVAVGDAGNREGLAVPGDFEIRLFAAIRSRRTQRERPLTIKRALPIAVSVLLMLGAASLAVRTGSPGGAPVPAGQIAAGGLLPADTSSRGGDDALDRVVAPEEIPFTLDEDLFGTRSGRIPATTYVLEPAPEEQPVVRASL